MTNKKKKREDLLENKIYRTIIDILEILNRPLTFEQLKICLTNNQSKYSKDWKHENQAILNKLKTEGVNIRIHFKSNGKLHITKYYENCIVSTEHGSQNTNIHNIECYHGL